MRDVLQPDYGQIEQLLLSELGATTERHRPDQLQREDLQWRESRHSPQRWRTLRAYPSQAEVVNVHEE